MSEAISRFLMARSERERMLVVVASILLGLALTYAYIWLPVSHERDRLLVRVSESQAESLAMEQAAQELAQLRAIPPQPTGLKGAIEQAISESLAARAPEIAQYEPTRVRISIASATTSQAFDSVARLQALPGVRVESVRLASLGDGDRVKIEAVFVKSP